MQKLILSSTSPTRKVLLERLGIPFETASPDIDETPLVNESAETMVARLAEAKAQVHADKFLNALIIACDQVLLLDNEMLTKPGNKENAIIQLSKCSGRRVTSLTGLCLLNTKTNHAQVIVETFYIHYKTLSHDMILHYLERDNPYHCAGSVKAEKLGIALFEKMEGDDPNALTGLPLIKLIKLLELENIRVL